MKVTYTTKMSTFILLKSIISSIGRRSTSAFQTFHPRTQTNNNNNLFAFAMSPHNKRPNSNMVGSTSSSLFSTSSSATLNATMPSTSTNTNTKSFSVATVAATSAAAAFVASNAMSSTETTFCEENNDMTNTMPFPEEAIIADTYNGVTVDVSDLPSHLSTCPIAFEKALTQALIIWEQEGKRGIWLKLSKQFANLIPVRYLTFKPQTMFKLVLLIFPRLMDTDSELFEILLILDNFVCIYSRP